MLATVWDAIESVPQALLLWLDRMAAAVPLLREWSWAVAVVLLTLVVRVLLLPTLLLQLRFLRRMDTLKPELKEIRDRNDVGLGRLRSEPGKLASSWVKSEEEQGALLKERGVRWYAGLLPPLLQVPAVVIVLRLLASDERTSGLTPATPSFVPPPTTSFFHSDEGKPLLVITACLMVLLVHLGQRRAIAAAPVAPTGIVRGVRLAALPALGGLVALNLPLTIVLSVLTSLLWGIGQSTWLAARRKTNEVGRQGLSG